MRVRIRALLRLSVVAVFAASLSLAALTQITNKASAEGTHQMNEMQTLNAGTVIYADILSAGETINISVCEDTEITIWDTEGTLDNTEDDSKVVGDSEGGDGFTANLDCGAALPNPIIGAYEYTPETTGTFRIELGGAFQFARYDFTVTPNNSTNPDPTVANGRIWSYDWQFSTGSFAANAATDADLYALVPAPTGGEHFVWKLDLNKFSGNAYNLTANSIGLNAPYSGISAPQGDSSVTPQYPIYLGYPDVAGDQSSTTPTIANLNFLDSDEEDDTFSPGGTSGVQDTGTFNFTSNVGNGTYAITIDTNKDGVYGTGDRLLLGNVVQGANQVEWDGTYPNGDPVADGAYNARVQVRIGEFHFVASDVETSGGTTDGGATWAPGLTIYKAIDAETTENTTVYWDDLTELGAQAGASGNVPAGVTSGSMADADNDGRPDGFHTWGNFSGSGVGNGNNIDTYVYGASDAAYVNMGVASVDGTDDDGVSSSVEYNAPNNGDGNGDGQPDHVQDNVTSLPNPVASGAYNTLEVDGCDSLSDVAIMAENELGTEDGPYEYPVGLFNFEINCATPGASANVKVYYDKLYDTSNWQARKFVNGHYSIIASATFGTAVVGSETVTTLSYSITDGGPLDEDGIANGVIVDPVGPGIGGSSSSGIVGAPNTGLGQTSIAMPVLASGAGLAALTFVAWHVRRQEHIA